MSTPGPAPAILLHDDGAATLGPMTELRRAQHVRTGVLTAHERAGYTENSGVLGASGPGLACLAEAARALPEGVETVLVVSARSTVGPAELGELEPGAVLAEAGTGEVVAWMTTRAGLDGGGGPGPATRETTAACLLRRPWDVIRLRDETVAADLRLVLSRAGASSAVPAGVTVMGGHQVWIAADAAVCPGVVIDATGGAVLIEPGATVRPGAVLVGPVSIGAGSTVLEHALIKANTVIGPVCKVAGEVGGTIFQGHANKGHDGHLGDSWVGSWANLGAGTTNSNLLNTYSEISARAEPGAPRERTGLQFFGAVIGDHVKTAISTRIFTGTVLGTGAMIASTAPPPACVPAFSWITDAGTKPYEIEKFLTVARAVMARRGESLGAEEEAALRALASGAPGGVGR